MTRKREFLDYLTDTQDAKRHISEEDISSVHVLIKKVLKKESTRASRRMPPKG